MKQHITVNQLYELKGKPHTKLIEYLSPKGPCGQMCITDEMYANKTTIGKMIEILDPKEETIFTMCKFISAGPPIYEITVNGDYYYEDNMCDALWEAVKNILVK